MKKRLKILIIEDHLLTIEGLISSLSILNQEGYELIFNTAETCDIGYKKIMESSNKCAFDVVFLDILLKPSRDGKILSGEDLGIEINNLFPEIKLIVLTGIRDYFRIKSILNELRPEGFLIKSDITNIGLIRAFEKVIYDPPFYSPSVVDIIKRDKFFDNLIDDIDNRILLLLSRGILTKELPEYIKLSISGIEKRKRRLKFLFDAQGKGDSLLIDKARNSNII